MFGKRGLVLMVALALTAWAGTAQAAEVLLTGFQNAGYTTSINGATFTNVNPRTTGTGYVDPFLKFTDNGPTEQAYNYDAETLPDLQPTGSYGSDNWTNLLWSKNLEVTNIAGDKFWTFILDIDQAPGQNAYYSLDQLALFYSSSATVNPGTGTYPAIPNLGTMFYNMDWGTDVALSLNYSLNTGSGSGDLKVLIPVPSGMPSSGAYIYLYHAGGFYGTDWKNNNGPDEWWVNTSVPVIVPDGGSMMMLLGLGLIGLAGLRRRLK